MRSWNRCSGSPSGAVPGSFRCAGVWMPPNAGGRRRCVRRVADRGIPVPTLRATHIPPPDLATADVRRCAACRSGAVPPGPSVLKDLREELFRPRRPCLRVAEELVAGAVLDDLAGVHED